MAADRKFYEEVFDVARETLDKNANRLKRDGVDVDDVIDAIDIRRGGDYEKNGWDFADAIWDIMDRRYGNREWYADDLADVVARALTDMIKKASRGSRRDRDDRDRDRGRSRSRRSGSFDDDDDRGSRRSSRRSGGGGLFDDKADDAPARPSRSRERESARATETPAVAPAGQPIMGSKYYSPFEQLTKEDIAASTSIDSSHIDESMRARVQQMGIVLGAECSRISYEKGVGINVFEAAMAEISNSPFDAVSLFYRHFPRQLLGQNWLIAMRVPTYEVMDVSLVEFQQLQSQFRRMTDTNNVSYAAIYADLKRYSQGLWKTVSTYLMNYINRRFFQYLRSDININQVLKIGQFEDLEEVMNPDFKIAISEDLNWEKMLITIVHRALRSLVGISLCNEYSEESPLNWYDFMKCDAVYAVDTAGFPDRRRMMTAPEPERRAFIDEINERMVFWGSTRNVYITNVLTHGTLRHMRQETQDMTNRPDYLALMGMIGPTVAKRRGDMSDTEIYASLYKEDPKTYLRKLDVVTTMDIQKPTSFLVSTPDTVLGL